MRPDYLAAGAVIVAAVAWAQAPKPDPSRFLTQPLIPGIYTADPSAHVFDGRIFIYPSHDIESKIPADDLGSQFDMRDFGLEPPKLLMLRVHPEIPCLHR